MFSFHLIITLLVVRLCVQQTDNFASYFTGDATAMDIHYASSTVVLANTNREIRKYPASFSASPTAIITVVTTHKSAISTLAVSPNGSLVLSGGRDFTAMVYSLGTTTPVCKWDELRGDIISSKIGPDNNFYAFGSNEGYLYYGYISNCSISRYNKTDYPLAGVEIVESKNEVWAADSATSILVVNRITNAVSSYNLPTSKVHSLMQMESANSIGVCTSRAFYILDYNGIIQSTLPYPSLYTRKCRLMESATAGTYYLTAITEQTSYNSAATIYPLWNIWTILASPYNATLYLEQRNSGSRYSGTSTVLEDAGTFEVKRNGARVTSIADGFNPYYNLYQDNSGSCSSTFFKNNTVSLCQKCNWDTSQRAYCSQCSSAAVCNQCSVYTIFVNSGGVKYCAPCPSNCYSCLSTTSCQVCFGGYTLKSGTCVSSNITGCVNAYWNNQASFCYQCGIGYFAENNDTCKRCDAVYANCTECDTTKCLRCQPNFVMMSTTSTNCEICSHAIEGCAACINQTWCDTCYENYPYFDIPNATYRFCKRACYYSCLTCPHTQYNVCSSCDSNRTLTSSNTCICRPQYPIENTTSWQCQACEDYIPNCVNCTSKSFCTECDPSFYFDDVSATNQSCKKCNYTCESCTTTWYSCTTCNASQFRVLDPVTGRCVCQSISYFQYGSQVQCQLCSKHISNCDVCHNQTYCVTCLSGYYIKSTGTGTNVCDACQTPCLQCFSIPSNCTDCASGRQLNYTTFTCDCLSGYYATGPTTCAPCSPILGSCLQCNNDSVCLQCWQNNYFVMQGGKKICDLCQVTCLTCATWNNQCATCDPLANRVLNTTTKQCNCIVGYTQTDGRCLNCTATFDLCTSCNATTCFSCQPGYSLAFGGLKCVDCQASYPGCTLCLNGLCAACNETAGYELSYSKCICQPGYYFKQLLCLPYAMGKSVQRVFDGYPSYKQNTDTGQIEIEIYFRCQGIKIPYGITNSIIFTVNDIPITSYQVQQMNTTFTFKFMLDDAYSMARIKIQFKNKTLFDLDEYGPRNRVYEFNKNIYHSTQYQISLKFAAAVEAYIIPTVRWMASILILLGCADLVLMLVFTTHLLPAFLLLQLSPPMYLKNVLESMIKINYKSLFVFADINVKYEDFGQYARYVNVYGATGGIVSKKIMDLVFMGCILAFYGILCPKLAPYIPAGKLQKLWEFKFVLKKYSNISNILLCFLPSFLTLSVFDLRIEKFNPSLTFSIGIASILLAFSGVFVFLHAMILYNTQFNDSYKNEDCYFGSSILQVKSITYILSLIIVMIWSIPMMGIIDGIYCIPILIVVLLWHMSHFRFWDNFPNKILYFLKIFYSVFLFLYIIAFLIFSISERYAAVEIRSLQLIGLCTMVNIIVLFSFSAVQTVFLIIHGLYKQCKMSPNIVDNIEEEKQQTQAESNEGSSVYNMRIRLAQRQKEQEMFDAKLTNKQQHMKKFREQYLKTNGDKMYVQSKTEEGFNSTGFSTRTNVKKQR